MEEYLTAFPATMALLEPIMASKFPTGPNKDAEEAQKRLGRAKMLHTVITAKLPALKLDDLKTMTGEWIHGALQASYPLEKALIDIGMTPDCRADLELLELLVDGAHNCVEALANLFAQAGRLKVVKAAAEGNGSEDAPPPPPPTAEAASAAVRAAMSQGTAAFGEVVPSGVPATQILGAELWEALCWRRGALRYYVVSCAVKRATEGPPGAAPTEAKPAGREAQKLAASAAAPLARTIDLATQALRHMLEARCDPSDPAAMRKQPVLLTYGVYTDTHLLALAFLGELAYWRWAAAAGEESSSGEGCSSGSRLVWFRDAAVCVHRYLHTVDVLMEGCMWSTERSNELLGLLTEGEGERQVAKALAEEAGVAERIEAGEAARLAAMKVSSGEAAPAAARRKEKKGKKGKAAH